MSLASGARLGPYDILSPVGAGGMGEVYRAHDARLGRDVAIKVLPQSFLADSERLHRFELEARATAALNHPNILAVYDIGRHETTPFIVSELLEGGTLRERLEGGPIAARRAVEYAIQVARGLAAAHEKGIVHRDLKPENLFVTPDHRVKILDFGLAKPTGQGAGVGSPLSVMPTLPPATAVGAVLGTVGYMAPEQVRGLPADHRADIFALGAVLYEMVAGRRAFRGDTAADTMTAILKEDPPPLATTSEPIAPGLMRLIDRCLDKNPVARFQSASDLAFALENLSSAASGTAVIAAVPVKRPRPIAAWAVAGLTLAALAIALPIAVAHWREVPPSAPVLRFDVPVPADVAFSGGAGYAPGQAVSPDGRFIVFMATRSGSRPMLWLRALDQTTMRPLSGTENGFFPFWSPDSSSIAFFVADKLKRIDLATGSVQTICDAPAGEGGSWGRAGVIVFAAAGNVGLSRVAANGGIPEPATTLAETERSHRWPHFLPDGRRFLYLATGGQLHAGSIDTRESSPAIVATVSKAMYAEPGYLLYVKDGSLFAQSFDAGTLKVTGEPVLLAEDVRTGGTNGRTSFSVSESGVLVYRTGVPAATQNQLTWLDRRGGRVEPVGGIEDYRSVALAPDATRAIVHRHEEPGGGGLWLMDLVRGTTSRFSKGDTHEGRTAWSPDGTRAAYAGGTGTSVIFGQVPGGIGEPETLLKGSANMDLTSWSSEALVYTTATPGNGTDIWIMPLTGDRTPRAAVKTPYSEFDGTLSPDGHWLAYTSNETGRNEIYVQPFPSGTAKWTISTSGGVQPVWRPDGGELFYMTDIAAGSSVPNFLPGQPRRTRGVTSLMSVDVRPGETVLSVSAPKVIYQSELIVSTSVMVPGAINSASATYGVARDGQRFLMLQSSAPQEDTEATPLTVVMNWTAGLTRK